MENVKNLINYIKGCENAIDTPLQKDLFNNILSLNIENKGINTHSNLLDYLNTDEAIKERNIININYDELFKTHYKEIYNFFQSMIFEYEVDNINIEILSDYKKMIDYIINWYIWGLYNCICFNDDKDYEYFLKHNNN